MYALGVALSPIPIAAILIILSRCGASTEAACFACAWTVGVAAAAAVFSVLVIDLHVRDSRPAWIAATYLVLAAGFFVTATTLWLPRRGRPASQRWLETVGQFTPGRAATLALVLSDANPKVLALSLGAALSLARAHANSLATASSVVLFGAIGATGVLMPIVACLVLPAQNAPRRTSVRTWLAKHERVVLTLLALAISALFLYDGITALR